MSGLQIVRNKHGTVFARRRDPYYHSRAYLQTITPSQVGAGNSAAKLTDAKALAIYHAPGKHAVIALEYGVTEPHVGKIKRKELWKHIHSQSETQGDDHGK